MSIKNINSIFYKKDDDEGVGRNIRRLQGITT